MAIWSGEIKELSVLYESLSGQYPDLEKELERLIKADDENMVLLYSRRCLEVIVNDLCETELNRPRKTEPLKGIIDKLNKEEKVPSHIITSMLNLNSLSTYGTHPKEFDLKQVKPVLNNLSAIIEWYLKYKEPEAITKPQDQITEEIIEKSPEQIRKPQKRLILLSGLALVVVIVVAALFVFNIIGGEKQTEELEKSIAVRPFWNESTEQENEFFVNGMAEDIRNNLAKIADLRVLSRGSVEKYKDFQYSTIDIARALDVTYVLEGTAQRIGNQVKIHVQLILAEREDHIWETTYTEEIEDVKQVFDLQSQIAQSVAEEIKAIIKPEEKELIEKTRTTNLTAFDFYLRGSDEHTKYRLNRNDTSALNRAEEFYYLALEYDPSYAQAYLGLAGIYWNKNYWETYFTKQFLDSVLIYADIALSFDDKLAEAHSLKGDYYRQKGDTAMALEEYETALTINPNYWKAYRGAGNLYSQQGDYVRSLESLHKAVQLNRDRELPNLLRSLAWNYLFIGFPEKSIFYCEESIRLDGDSAAYLYYLAVIESVYNRNLPKTIELYKQGYSIDSTNNDILEQLANSLNLNGQYELAMEYYQKLLSRLESQKIIRYNMIHRVAYCYWKIGKSEEADDYFDLQQKHCEEAIELNRPYASNGLAYYDLAGVYAFRGEKEKAIYHLPQYNQIINRSSKPRVWFFKNDLLFDSIKDEPEFQQIVRDVEAKYQAEHERVRKWLEEQGMLQPK